CALTDAELEEDRSAMGGLVLVAEIGSTKRSLTFRYYYPPQEHGIRLDTKVRDPRTRKSAGQIEAIDELNRTIDLRRSRSSAAQHPSALVPFDIVPSTVLR